MLAKYLQNSDDFDSISQYSESTLASDLAAHRIAAYSYDLRNDGNKSDKVQVVNIRVDAVNLFGENGGSRNSSRVKL